MDPIEELVGPRDSLSAPENSALLFGQLTELIILVLELQIRQLYVINYLFPHLWVNRNIVHFGLFCNLTFCRKVKNVEPLLVKVYEDKLAAQPLCYIVVGLAHALASVSAIITSLEQEYKLAGFRRIVITLHLYRCLLQALKLLEIEGQINNWGRVRFEEGRITVGLIIHM